MFMYIYFKLTPIFINLVFKSKIANRIYLGGVIGLISVVVILFPDLNQLTSEFIIGIVMALAGTVNTSIGDVLSLYNTNPVLEIL